MCKKHLWTNNLTQQWHNNFSFVLSAKLGKYKNKEINFIETVKVVSSFNKNATEFHKLQ